MTCFNAQAMAHLRRIRNLFFKVYDSSRVPEIVMGQAGNLFHSTGTTLAFLSLGGGGGGFTSRLGRGGGVSTEFLWLAFSYGLLLGGGGGGGGGVLWNVDITPSVIREGELLVRSVFGVIGGGLCKLDC